MPVQNSQNHAVRNASCHRQWISSRGPPSMVTSNGSFVNSSLVSVSVSFGSPSLGSASCWNRTVSTNAVIPPISPLICPPYPFPPPPSGSRSNSSGRSSKKNTITEKMTSTATPCTSHEPLHPNSSRSNNSSDGYTND